MGSNFNKIPNSTSIIHNGSEVLMITIYACSNCSSLEIAWMKRCDKRKKNKKDNDRTEVLS